MTRDEAFDRWWRAKELAGGGDPDGRAALLRKPHERLAWDAATERAAGVADEVSAEMWRRYKLAGGDPADQGAADVAEHIAKAIREW